MRGGSKWTDDDDDDVIEALHVTGVLSFGSAVRVEHAAGAAGVRGLLNLKSSLQAQTLEVYGRLENWGLCQKRREKYT